MELIVNWLNKEEKNEYLNMELHNINGLEVKSGYGSFLYLLFIRNDVMTRKVLQKEEVYILTLWPDVLEKRSADSLEFWYIATILPILVDQRYEISDMKYWVEVIKNASSKGDFKWYKLYC